MLSFSGFSYHRQQERDRKEIKHMKNRLHVKAPGNWVNDPNGMIYYKGQYHLFYQHFPYAPRWGTMHWGHAVSPDLIHWEHVGVALFPSLSEDQNGCFSGSAVEENGVMHLFYTGVHYNQVNPKDIHQCLDQDFTSAQLHLTSKDGMHFDVFGDKEVVIPALTDPEIGDNTHTRDPKVWKGSDAWYMVLGSTTRDHKGEALFYKSEDLSHWHLAGQATTKQKLGWMWECPDYYETKGGKVLSFSPMGFLKDGYKEENQNICMVVDFEEESCTMTMPDQYQFLDYGLDLYAAQSTVDQEGRRVMAAWVRMPETVGGEWIGMMCSPRVVEVEDGHIYFRMHPAVRKAYSRAIDTPKEAAEAGYRAEADLEEGDGIDVGGYRIYRKGNRICTDRSLTAGNDRECRMQFETPEMKMGGHVEILVDSNLIEVFVNDGEYVISNAVYGIGNEIVSDRKVKLFTVE